MYLNLHFLKIKHRVNRNAGSDLPGTWCCKLLLQISFQHAEPQLTDKCNFFANSKTNNTSINYQKCLLKSIILLPESQEKVTAGRFLVPRQANSMKI